ncbi:MAG: putative bifunctional diguanylate cyclase/phosphodiesterase [Methyloligellaceae bacterium]
MSKYLSLLKAFRRKEVIDAISIAVLGVIAWSFVGNIDFLGGIYLFSLQSQSYDVGKIFTAIILISIGFYVFMFRRNVDLQAQILERKEADKNVAWIAQHDLLTKLPNRHFLQNFIAHLDDAKDKGEHKSYAFFAIDLDGFKKVNDLLGHHGGDELLVTLATRLGKLAPDDIIVRLGGDEFVIIAERDEGMDYQEFAEEIILELSTPVRISDNYVEVGACVGVSIYPDDANLISEVSRCADVAMYVAKNNGRGSIKKFQTWMDSLLVKRAEIEQSLRQAVKNDDIIPHYQPLVDLNSGEIKGFEALARWTDPTGELIPPSIFIEIAEESGLIITLTENLLRKACMDAIKWPPGLRLSFNISPTQLNDKLLGLRILNILGETGWSPMRLEIEITESTLISDTEIAIKILQDLHDAGVSIAIDDFGTGYSSLSQLAQFNFDKIKIDRSFVMQLEKDEKSRNVVKAMLSLGKGLGISTLAEGIEKETELEALKEMGCDMGQGYLFGKPQSTDDVMEILRELSGDDEKRAQSGP